MINLKVFALNFKTKVLKISKDSLSNVEKVELRRCEPPRLNNACLEAARRKVR